MDAHLRAGVAIYNTGEYHAAHDAWEDHWLALDSGTDDERLLHGLIQFTAAVHHANERNWSGATGLAASALEYLDGLPSDYRGVSVGVARDYLAALAADPERVERARPPRLTVDGAALTVDDLRFDDAAVAAVVLAEKYGYDEAVLERAAEYGRQDLDDGAATSPFVTHVLDFCTNAERRPVVYQRLQQRVQRRRSRETDVEGLF
ncbi:DUF309 domain-containing protein [Haloarculaceae archaeon H-GB2-1]|nr:DUF309 domain-containing protein [Haloarculaceae archaeon H-GB1-1]MEA5388364.1 DUF309 domain-containing protein [Haloarculaceae archaeon H-GB11]MEA5406401.1 DUF309 domain-containing protein [Haloarculaceae archaeon H-GB2-1]